LVFRSRAMTAISAIPAIGALRAPYPFPLHPTASLIGVTLKPRGAGVPDTRFLRVGVENRRVSTCHRERAAKFAGSRTI
jgi:hypothetical protein